MTHALAIIRRAADVLRTILGVPSYDRYTAHMQRQHPGAVMMTRDEFLMERLNDRYARPGSRCC